MVLFKIAVLFTLCMAAFFARSPAEVEKLDEERQETPGIEEFKMVKDEVHEWYFGISDLVLVIGGITGILGGARLYANWQAGKPRMDSEVSGWFLACLFLNLIGTALKALFHVP